MIYLSKKEIARLVVHAKSSFPAEACGILAGSSGRVEEVFEMTNVHNSGESFFMDPEEQFKVAKEVRARGMEILAIYHSHVSSSAYPSSEDVDMAYDPRISYVIISLTNSDRPAVRSFKINGNSITEEEVVLY